MLFKPKNIILVLVLGFFLTPQSTVATDKIKLPDLGDSSATLMSPTQEKELGSTFFRYLHSKIDIVQDAEIQNYISSIGAKLVSNSDLLDNQLHFFIVLDKEINAFAVIGGYIGIHSGLLLLTESESQLTAVIAHEIAHIRQRHAQRAIEASGQLSVPRVIASLLAALLGTQNLELGQAALIAIQAGATQFKINFTRNNEKEADSIGMQILSKSNFDPKSMPVFFESMQQAYRYHGKNIPEFLRTHPVSTTRIADAKGRVRKHTYKQYSDTQDYLLVKAKLRVMTATEDQAVLKYFQIKSHQGTKNQQAIARYGIALAYLKAHNFLPAKKLFRQLANQYQNQPQYALAMAETAFKAKQYKTAQKLFDLGLKRFPDNNAIKLAYIVALLQINQPKQAKSMLQTLSDQTKKQPLYFKLLAETYQQLKQPAKSHYYLAEYHYLSGNTKVAILQIKLAKKVQGEVDSYLRAILEYRLRFFLDSEKQNTKLF